MKVFTVPTGRIFVMDGAKGQLEFLKPGRRHEI